MCVKVAVAMSVYEKDCVDDLKQAINSVLDQSYTKFVLYIARDGLLSNELNSLLLSYEENTSVVLLDTDNVTRGLAFRLNEIVDLVVKNGTFRYLARMDSDDICDVNRLEKQVNFLNENSEIHVVGSSVIEFNPVKGETYYKRMKVDHEDMVVNFIKRCPFNHPSVMFDLQVFEDGMRYDSKLLNTQDYFLWVELLRHGYKFANIDEPLLKFRVNEGFSSRRGYKKAFIEAKSRLYAMRVLNMLTVRNVIYTSLLLFLRLSPDLVKKFAYRYLR